MLLLALTLAGCETAGRWFKGQRTAEPADPIILGAPEANSYLADLYRLAAGDPATQAEIFADAESQATLTPDTRTRLRYALMLASAGHPGSDPQAAQSLLRELLAQPELMTQSELALATVFLEEAEARLVLDAEARRLRAEYTRAANTEQAAIERRIGQVEDENRQLRQSLEEAEAKLEAITSIERSIRERSEESESQ
jgi:hypothetical protein